MTNDRVGPTETIARGVFSRRQFADTIGRVKPNAFLEAPHVQRLSVDRTDEAPEEELVRLAEKRAAERSKTFYGWAKLSVADAEKSGRGVEVRASPKTGNRYHADIVLPSTERTFQKHVANRLARTSRWFRRPT